MNFVCGTCYQVTSFDRESYSEEEEEELRVLIEEEGECSAHPEEGV